MPVTVGVVPFDNGLLDDELFRADSRRNRDDVLQPWRLLRARLRAEGGDAVTIDRIDHEPDCWLHLDSTSDLRPGVNASRAVVVILEPEFIAPFWYERSRSMPLPDAVLLPSNEAATTGSPKVHRLRFPVVLPELPLPSPGRDKLIVMVNANKHNSGRDPGLYPERERVAAWLARHAEMQVYGPGWGELRMRAPRSWWAQVQIGRCAPGPVGSKYEPMRQAVFALCFENCRVPGYRSEKLFDALHAGAIPVYYGDPTIARDVPPDAFIDYEALGSPAKLLHALRRMGPEEIETRQTAGAAYLASPAFDEHRVSNVVDRLVRFLVSAARTGS